MDWDEIPPPEPPDFDQEPGSYDDYVAAHGDDVAPPPDHPHTHYDDPGYQDAADEFAQHIVTTLRQVLAATHERPMSSLREVIGHMRRATRVFKVLDERRADTYDALLEALDAMVDNTTGMVDLYDVPSITEFDVYGEDVKSELRAVQREIGADVPGDATSRWFALVERVQREAARDSHLDLVDAIDRKEPASKLLVLHRKLELPTSQSGTSTSDGEPLLAADWQRKIERDEAGSDEIRISSGYRSLDLSATSPGEPLGWITPGDLNIKAAGTGQGKSSDSIVSVPAAAQDLRNWGLTDAKVLLLHTEEEVKTKVRQFQLWNGMHYHHLASNIAIRKVGTRLQRCATAIYDLVIQAVKQANGGDPKPYLPHVVFVDYIQSIKADPTMKESDSVAQAANFFLYGVAAFDFEEMALYSGVDFREYAGMAIPDGIEGHRVAVICYAQLIKQSGERQFFKPDHRSTPIGDFVVEDASGRPGWEVLPGDLRIPTQDEVRGGGQLLQHASNLIFLHRSTPQQEIIRPPDGPPYLADRRARFILSKTRAGMSMPFVPMEFSSNPNPGVNKGQYWDFLAEQAMDQGRFRPDDSWRRRGDFIVPRRKAGNPLAGVRY